MADVPERLGIAPVHQEIPRAILTDIEEFIRVFDRVTSRRAWQERATTESPEITRFERSECCFFSAWDFHVPEDRPEAWQLVEFNDNGSGLLLAALLNRHHYELSELERRQDLEPPAEDSAFAGRLASMIRAEAEGFWGAPLHELVLILDAAESIEQGRFRDELRGLRDVCRQAGWRAELATPAETIWDGTRLRLRGEPVAFVVNRSTDFYFEHADLAALSSAYRSQNVYVAPNPFTYATRSDKRLLEWLSNPARDSALGILPEERAVLSAHVPETRVVLEQDIDELAGERDDWFFKPSHGFASRGLLHGADVGRTRLRRLLKKGESYVAQRKAPKLRLETGQGVSLWADLRVWAYRGERFLLSGRASRSPDRLDLSPPGGWLPTYASLS